MKKSFILLIGAMLFIAACTSDNSASDNENIPDELTPTDDTVATADDAVIPTDDDQTDPTDTEMSDLSDGSDESDSMVTDEDDIATDDILTDETGEGGGNDEDAAVSDDDSVVVDPVACCVEIVKEWWRCDAEVADPYTPGYTTEKADECIACVSGLAACTDFLPLDAQWACADACNDICPPGTVFENDDNVGKGLGKSRRAVAEEYCIWMVDAACAYEPGDFTGLGSTEPLSACF